MPPTVGWRLTADDPSIASVRYRCLIPARGMERAGIRSIASWGAVDPLAVARPSVLVFVKAFGAFDRRLAERAVEARIPVILDVCDNVFAPGYRDGAADELRQMAELAAATVTTGPALAAVLRRELPAMPVHEVPDPVETLAEADAAQRYLWKLRFRLRSARALAGAGVRGARGTSLRPGRPRPGHGPDRVPQVLWFGNAGSVSPRFGLVNLADIADEISRARDRRHFRVAVVSGDRKAYDRIIEPLELETAFLHWSPEAVDRELARSSVVILPNSRDPFSICKSANRATLALAHGVPVVASRIPSLEPLKHAVLFDDFEAGIHAYLADPSLVRTHLDAAQPLLDGLYSPAGVSARWSEILVSIADR